MPRENYKVMKDLFGSLGDYELREKAGGNFSFTFYLTDAMREMDIESLELSVRSLHVLKRAEYSTVGDLAEGIARGDNIKQIRNCGTKSYAEIMEKLFLFNLLHMSEKRRLKCFLETVEKNLNIR